MSIYRSIIVAVSCLLLPACGIRVDVGRNASPISPDETTDPTSKGPRPVGSSRRHGTLGSSQVISIDFFCHDLSVRKHAPNAFSSLCEDLGSDDPFFTPFDRRHAWLGQGPATDYVFTRNRHGYTEGLASWIIPAPLTEVRKKISEPSRIIMLSRDHRRQDQEPGYNIVGDESPNRMTFLVATLNAQSHPSTVFVHWQQLVERVGSRDHLQHEIVQYMETTYDQFR